MPSIPCPVSITCPGSDDPISNYSSEAPDLINFLGIGFPIYNPDNPIDPWRSYTALGCLSSCVSNVSQDDADACAAAQTFLCQESGRLPKDSAPVLFYNQQQSCSFPCPDGTDFIWTVLAGSVVTENQDLSNRIAAEIACERAAQRHLCLPSLNGGCANSAFSQTIRISSGVAPLVYTITAGALPPGVTMTQTDTRTVVIAGTPTTAGSYPFSLTVQDPAGNYITKNYTFQVLGITPSTLPAASTGTAYNQTLSGVGGVAPYTFAIQSGTLPTGLAIAANGAITGTPTAGGDSTFVVSVIDAATGSCSKQFTLHVNSAVCPVLLSSVPNGGAAGGESFAVYAPATGDVLHPDKVFICRAAEQDFAVMDVATSTFYTTINFIGNLATHSACYYPTTPTVYAEAVDGGGNFFIQLINAKTNALGITLGDATYTLFGSDNIRYAPAANKVWMIGDNGAPAGTDICEIDPTVNSFTRWPCTVNPGAGIEIANDWYYCPDNNRIYVGCRADTAPTKAFLRAFNATTHAQVLATDFEPNIIVGLIWVSTVSRLYLLVRNRNTGAMQVFVYNVTTDTIEATIDLASTTSNNYLMEFWVSRNLLMIPLGNNRKWIDVSSNTVICTLVEAGSINATGFSTTKFFSQPLTNTNLLIYH